MQTVTLELDDDTARWARKQAERAGIPVERWLTERLASEAPRSAAVQMAALERFLRGPGWPGVSENLPKRDELYDRPALRRHQHPDLRSRPGGSGEEK